MLACCLGTAQAGALLYVCPYQLAEQMFAHLAKYIAHHACMQSYGEDVVLSVCQKPATDTKSTLAVKAPWGPQDAGVPSALYLFWFDGQAWPLVGVSPAHAFAEIQ